MEHSQQRIVEETKRFFQKVYGWMFLGLFISGVTAYWIAGDPSLYKEILFNKILFFSLLIGELLLVVGLVWLMKRISANLAVFMFLLYCFILNAINFRTCTETRFLAHKKFTIQISQ